MAELLLTFHSAAVDASTIGDALRAAFRVPVHIRGEAVLGLDFSDATTAERVTGSLDRAAIELIVEAELLRDAIAVAARTKRKGPFRWQAIPIIERGRMP
ncbi:DUF3240 domain-containing protein [Sphingomonas sp. S1-29]|uniref:DUF3240 domain-containing protein n=1 Tax=Sphingomonas sp. S1-29 TaxID=2991074 RepID=UPI00223F7AE9|nr:DUF3240 domain-containing protein [Sphingomonas sp. S1-29]UZK70581.1 DUF3240 domain-containing protein [Sphingomonas sp. S1-29]